MRVVVGVTPDWHYYLAFLDGIDISNVCFEADEEQGYVKVYIRDSRGGISRDTETGGPAWETRHGVVHIYRKEVNDAITNAKP